MQGKVVLEGEVLVTDQMSFTVLPARKRADYRVRQCISGDDVHTAGHCKSVDPGNPPECPVSHCLIRRHDEPRHVTNDERCIYHDYAITLVGQRTSTFVRG